MISRNKITGLSFAGKGVRKTIYRGDCGVKIFTLTYERGSRFISLSAYPRKAPNPEERLRMKQTEGTVILQNLPEPRFQLVKIRGFGEKKSGAHFL